MKRHFALPITITAALHAGLLFGLPSPSRPASRNPLPPSIKPRDIPFVFDLIAAAATDDTTEAAKGMTSDPPPAAPEPPPPAAPTGFVIDVPREPPRSGDRGERIFEIRPPGVGSGALDGIGGGSREIVPSSGLDAPPRARSQIAPQYPHEPRRSGTPGSVTVEFVVDESGAVLAPRVVHASDRVFEEPTLRAVAKWRFEPGRRDGRVVRFRMAVPVLFTLERE
jgi:protein TonB